MNLLILGANGFIGSHLCEHILEQTDWRIHAMDLRSDKLHQCLKNQRFCFFQGDMTQKTSWIEEKIANADVVLPLAAIATPAVYVTNPLQVFELDFEANLAIVRLCVKYQKRLIFPSTSEVYGMCPDDCFDEESSYFVTGPIHKERWIYANSKQLLDRLIFAYGKHQDLSYTLFRPFNWYGPRLDNIDNPKPGASRVLSQFIGNVKRGETIQLVNGGHQKRCFTFIDDGIRALLAIIKNENNRAHNQVFNIGNPQENISIRKLAELILNYASTYLANVKQITLVETPAQAYYGDGYQDIALRVPAIERAKARLKWEPHVSIEQGLKETLAYYLSNNTYQSSA